MKNINRIKDIIINKLKNIWKKLKAFLKKILECILLRKKRFMIYGIIILISLLFTGLLSIISARIAGNVPDQNSYLDWGGKDYAQVSCFTSRADAFTTDELMRFEYELNNTLKNSKSSDDISQWTDAYSGKGTLTVTNGSTSVEGIAYGVGNNFFLFHPLQLISGSYIDTDNVMKDYIMLDEEAAWRLFGSSDVAGLSVNIDGEPHVVAGVFRRPGGRFNNASGNGEITFYISYEALTRHDENTSITAYEVIMANLVDHYAYNYINKYFQPDSTEEDEGGQTSGDNTSGNSTAGTARDIKILENSDRYSLPHKWEKLKNFGINAMDLDEISYPYWENVAAAYESVLTLIFFLQILDGFAILICVTLIILQLRRYMKQMQSSVENNVLSTPQKKIEIYS